MMYSEKGGYALKKHRLPSAGEIADFLMEGSNMEEFLKWAAPGEREMTISKNDKNTVTIKSNGKANIIIGEFTIEELSAGAVYIRHEGGEGGSFEISELEEVIRDFYNKNF